ncbi:MAG: hypothetical protein ACK4TC_14950 [Sphingomonas pseudosanguinis]|uniref:hypothetical protein n=1 Tax=Sphingomonas pseudosanguinis TaxID=413712 RepID=UPI003918DE8A
MYATLTQGLRALEVVRYSDVRRADPVALREATARAAIITHAIGVTLQLAAAVKAAAAGDIAPAVAAMTALRLDQVEVKP